MARRFFCDGESLSERPGVERGRSPFSPFVRYDSYHRNTELAEALMARATADSVWPSLEQPDGLSATPFQLLGSSGGLMPPNIVKVNELFHCLRKVQS